jgi:O-antigen/teichoic acid export membrane protein
MTVARQVAWNTVSQSAARAGVLGLAVVTTSLLTRHLGVSSYGDYIIVSVYVSLFAILFDWGISTMLARELPRAENAAELLGKAVALRLTLTLPVAALAAGLSFLFYGGEGEEQARNGILIALPTILTISMINTLSPIFQVRLKMDRVAVAEIASQTLGAALIIALVLADRSFYELILATVATTATYAALVYLFSRRLMRFRLSFDLAVWRQLLRVALPLGVAIVVGTIYFRADALILSLLKDSHDVGIYGVAYRFYEMTIPFPAFFLAPVFPLLSAAAVSAGGPAEFLQLLQRSFDVIVIAAVLVVAASLPLAPDLVDLVAGESFADSAQPLRILMVGAAFAFIANLFLFALIALDRQHRVLSLTLVALVVNLALNFALIPSYSYTAAAIIATGTQFVIVVGALYLVRRYSGFLPSVRVAAKAAIAGALVLIALAVMPTPLAVSLVVGALLYAILLLALRIDRDLDLHQLLRRA